MNTINAILRSQYNVAVTKRNTEIEAGREPYGEAKFDVLGETFTLKTDGERLYLDGWPLNKVGFSIDYITDINSSDIVFELLSLAIAKALLKLSKHRNKS